MTLNQWGHQVSGSVFPSCGGRMRSGRGSVGRREDWKDLVAQARAQIQAELGDRELPPPEEVLRQIREERDAQLLALR